MRALFLFLLACGDSDKAPTSAESDQNSAEVDWDCDPLDPSRCLLPFPSTFFMEESEQTASGWQVTIGESTIPRNIDLVQPDPFFYNEKDGFSPVTIAPRIIFMAARNSTKPCWLRSGMMAK